MYQHRASPRPQEKPLPEGRRTRAAVALMMTAARLEATGQPGWRPGSQPEHHLAEQGRPAVG